MSEPNLERDLATLAGFEAGYANGFREGVHAMREAAAKAVCLACARGAPLLPTLTTFDVNRFHQETDHAWICAASGLHTLPDPEPEEGK